ncbi:L-aspartate oxidase [Subtercola boreus]|uniref:L-aspartate oxidase n=1 Tax=Subtercola boreus TaxID=120213 RepID=A0A3E0VWK3_9MICO|nr:L-aspartate oxidase [Subtercola boreus]RFA13975.1 L-aspartate oxidase [Subtercola boreus]
MDARGGSAAAWPGARGGSRGARPTLVVVGSGIAGLVVAIEASRTHNVTLITKAELGESNTRYAQGGIAAAMFPEDSVASHVADTLAAGAGLNRRAAVEVLCAEGPARIRDLIRLGVEFDEEGGVLAHGLEAAHGFSRILHAGGDATGSAVERALVGAVRLTASTLLEDTFVSDLLVEDGRVAGVHVVLRSGEHRTLTADAVVLASGGAGQLYSHTTNPRVTTGDGVAAAYRAGAELGDLEFFQFHPTSMDAPGNFLVSEAVRGEGAVLLAEDGHRFMLDVHPDAELAPRDVVARAIARQMEVQGGRGVLLDASGLGSSFFADRFPSISAQCRRNGVDPSTEPIRVTPAAHYWMGGVSTDDRGRTTLPGLFAVGEVACTGVHGANRLASNSLLESVVYAWRAVEALQGRADDAPGPGDADRSIPERDERSGSLRRDVLGPGDADRAIPEREGRFGSLGGGDETRPFSRDALQQLMWDAVGVHRDGSRLADALEQFETWAEERSSGTAGNTGSSTGRNRAEADALRALEDDNLLLLAQLVTRAALARRESRGAHFRSDFPETDDAFGHHLVTRSDRRVLESL